MEHKPKNRPAGVEVTITPEMVATGTAAYERWSRFADAPLEGKRRTWFTERERERLAEEVVVREVLTAAIGNASSWRRGV